LRIRTDIPGQRWRYIHTVAGHVVYEGIGWAVEQIDTSVERMRSVQRCAGIDRRFVESIGTASELNLCKCVGPGDFAAKVHDAAEYALPV
jgi:hypothetical protein